MQSVVASFARWHAVAGLRGVRVHVGSARTKAESLPEAARRGRSGRHLRRERTSLRRSWRGSGAVWRAARRRGGNNRGGCGARRRGRERDACEFAEMGSRGGAGRCDRTSCAANAAQRFDAVNMSRLLERVAVSLRAGRGGLRRGTELERVGQLRDARVRGERRCDLQHGRGKQESEAQASTHGGPF